MKETWCARMIAIRLRSVIFLLIFYDYSKPESRYKPFGAAIEHPFIIELQNCRSFVRNRFLKTKLDEFYLTSTSPATLHLLLFISGADSSPEKRARMAGVGRTTTGGRGKIIEWRTVANEGCIRSR